MKLLDTVNVDDASTRKTADGYLVASARVSRANNIQMYSGDEMGRPDQSLVRVYRPESEVFARDAMSSVAHKPMTNDHPVDDVTSETWKRDAIGQMGDEVTRDGEFVRVPLTMMDGAAINDYEAGKRELSLGYTADIDWTPGTTDSGEHYDAVQRNIRVNHVALVAAGRAGQEVRIGDWHPPVAEDQVPTTQKYGGQNMADTRKVVVDGLTLDMSEQGAQAIDKRNQQLSDAQQALADAQAKHDEAIAAKDAELATKDAEIDDLKAKAMSDEDLDKAVAERADLIGKAQTVADADYTGKSPADIRKAAVVAKLGDDAIKDKSDAYVEARFDMLTEQADAADPVRAALASKPHNDAQINDNGQAEYEARLGNAWKTQEAR